MKDVFTRTTKWNNPTKDHYMNKLQKDKSTLDNKINNMNAMYESKVYKNNQKIHDTAYHQASANTSKTTLDDVLF